MVVMSFHVTISCVTLGGAVGDGGRFHDRCEGKRSSCITRQQAVTTPVLLHPAVAVTHTTDIQTELNNISKNGQKAARKARARRCGPGGGGSGGEC